ncbi:MULTISPECIES: hypothetical protein [unclassified Paenibacillus]|uniref:hypothetical protein n=1 Tax=unclassified Paenibacillus TaxID=185978 RepID=UPI000CFB9FFC|nr:MULTISPECIES: hypothetical protein [unclassified Paenibacillus]PRA04845.1 hypothetical protein CQ043_12380 [Paenibacillus sp. MYb63]PRA47810.1 hypothetical protein CQ061_14450 [Paenibacillus sp. MYb67]
MDWDWDIFFKAVGSTTVVVGAVTAYFAGKKYFYDKNRDLHLRRLNEVYAPLYGFLVRQEQLRDIRMPDIKRIDAPILTLTSVKSKQTTTFGESGFSINSEESEETLEIADRRNFLGVLNSTNRGLARPELLLILNKYEMLIHLEELKVRDEKWRKATAEKVKVEIELVNEIVNGYLESVQKLDISNKSSFKLIKEYLIK